MPAKPATPRPVLLRMSRDILLPETYIVYSIWLRIQSLQDYQYMPVEIHSSPSVVIRGGCKFRVWMFCADRIHFHVV
jgi:hypothetical protein